MTPDLVAECLRRWPTLWVAAPEHRELMLEVIRETDRRFRDAL